VWRGGALYIFSLFLFSFTYTYTHVHVCERAQLWARRFTHPLDSLLRLVVCVSVCFCVVHVPCKLLFFLPLSLLHFASLWSV
jgi:hypothetical protein